MIGWAGSASAPSTSVLEGFERVAVTVKAVLQMGTPVASRYGTLVQPGRVVAGGMPFGEKAKGQVKPSPDPVAAPRSLRKGRRKGSK